MRESTEAKSGKWVPDERGSWLANQVVYAEFLDDLDKLFTDGAVDYMPIKGAYLIKAGLAPLIPARKMVDIDILVRPEDFSRASACLENSGRTEFIKQKWFFEREYVYTIGALSCHLELHYMLNFEERFLLPAAKLFAQGLKRGERCVLPSHEDALLVLLCHALVHIPFHLERSIEREARLIAEQQGFSWVEFWTRARESGVTGLAEFLLGICGLLDNRCASVYARRAAASFSWERYKRMPVWQRRGLYELPFVRRPLRLLIRKVGILLSPGRPLTPG